MSFTVRMTELPHGWVKIRGSSLWRVFWSSPTRPVGSSYWFLLVGFQVVLHFGIRLVRDLLGPTAGWVAIGGLLLAIVAAGLYAASRSLTPSINFDEAAMRVGRKTYRFDEITDATFLTVWHRSGASGYLQFGTGRLPAAVVCLRSKRENELSIGDRDLVAEVLRRSAVRVPAGKPDRYDPTGKFGFMDHPNSLGKDEAIEYVLNTPASGEPVRTAPRPKWTLVEDD